MTGVEDGDFGVGTGGDGWRIKMNFGEQGAWRSGRKGKMIFIDGDRSAATRDCSIHVDGLTWRQVDAGIGPWPCGGNLKRIIFRLLAGRLLGQ